MKSLEKLMKDLRPASNYQSFLPVTEKVSLPFTLLKGKSSVPCLILTAGVHGSEYVGIKVLMDFVREMDLNQLAGSLCLFHLVNTEGFRLRHSHLVPEDGVDLNRIFQDGWEREGLSYQIKKVFQEEIFPLGDALIDLHGGNSLESLIPHAYYSTLAEKEVVELSKQMGLASDLPFIHASKARGGLYQAAAMDYGLPSVILEQGDRGSCQPEDVAALKKAVYRILDYLFHQKEVHSKAKIFTETYSLSSSYSGAWYSELEVGTWVKEGGAFR